MTWHPLRLICLPSLSSAAACVALAASLVACEAPARRPIGSTCDNDAQCTTGLCASDQCVEPAADADSDGLTNGLEAQLGSNAFLADSDADGIVDGAEIDAQHANVDTDGDGKADVIESATADADGDCITDQYDAEDATPNTDLSPMIPVVCHANGVCAGQEGKFRASCEGGVAVCVYTDIDGYVNPEVTCNAVDENCDGLPDDGFPDRDDDDIADCVDTDWDNDGVTDGVDVCPTVADPDQIDADADGVGDLCSQLYALVFTSAPSVATAGKAFAATVALAPGAASELPVGAPLPPFHGTVVVTLDAAGAAATLGGTTQLTAVAGVASFADLVIIPSGPGMALIATSGALAPGRSAAFDVVAGTLDHFVFEDAPLTRAAGDAFGFDVLAVDANGTLVDTYAGTAVLTSTDAAATLPSNVTFAAGRAHVSATLGTVGTQTVTVTASEDTAITAAFSVDVTFGAVARLDVTSSESPVVAGVAPTLTIRATDAYGNTVTSYTGVVAVTTDDPAVSGAVQVVFAAGAGGVATTDQVALETAGAHTVTATDLAVASVTGSIALTCVHAFLDHFAVTGPPATMAGAPFNVTVAARDAFDNPMSSDFVGTVALTSSDAGAQLPDAYDITANDVGAHTFVDVVLLAAGAQTITATDPVSGATGSLTLDVGAASDLVLRVISAPADVTAGVPFAMTVAVQDAFGNPPADFSGTITLTSNDAQFVPPAPVTIGQAALGHATFSSVVLKTSGTRRITASERTNGLAVGTNLNVAPAGAVRLGVSGPGAIVAGVPFSVTVTAYDAFDNVASGYVGIVGVASTDATMTPPTPWTFAAPDAGIHTFDGLVLETAGDQTLTLGDGTLTIPLATSVAPAAAASLAVTQLPGSVVAGVATGFQVHAYDAYGNVATGYTGTVAFTTSDPQAASLPDNHTFLPADAGFYAVSGLVLKTAGDQSITATDTLSTSLVASANTRVDPAAASSFSLVGTDASVPAGVETSVFVTARDPFGNVATGYVGAVTFASATDAQATMPANLLFAADDRGAKLATQLTFRTVGTQALTATDVADATRAGATTFEVLEGASKLFVLRNVPSRTTAGEAFGLSLEVTDTFGNRISDYTGTVAFTATDPNADLPTEYAFSETETGIHVFEGLVLETAGNQTLRVTDTSDDAITASALIGVDPASAATVEVSGLAAGVTAGAAQTLTLTVRDAFGNIATGFTGSLALASSDPSAVVPASVAMSGLGGQTTFTATFRTAGAQSLTAYLASPTAEVTATTTVAPAAADHLTVSPTASSGPAGTAFTIAVTARDQFENIATAYTGTVSFNAAQSGSETVPAATRFLPAELGVKTFTNGFNLRVAGTRTITASGSGLTTAAASAQRTVTPLALHHFALETVTTTTTAGTAFSVKATALDTYDNVVTGHTGIAHFAVDSGSATLPVDYTFLASDAGARTFTNGVTLSKAGARTVTVSDVATPSATGSVTVTITPASTHHFSLTPTPDTRRAGETFALTATALDSYGNTVTGYNGSVHFAVDSGIATLPANTPFVAGDNGQKAFSGFALELVGTRTVTVNDVAAPGITGTATITITPATIHHLTVATTPAGASTAGQAFAVNVTAKDTYGNTIPSYVGTVTFAAGVGGPNEVLPAAYTFVAGDGGTRDFPGGVTLTKSGTRTITATDAAGITGNTTRTINPATTHHLAFEVPSATVTAGDTLTFKVTAQDLYNNTTPTYAGTVQLSDNVAGNDIPAAHTYLLAENGAYTFTNAKLKVSGAHTITATDVGSPSITGTATRTVNPGPLHHLKFTPASANVTSNQVFTLRLSARDANDNVVPSYASPKKVTFTNTGGGLSGLPAEYAFSVADAGEHDFAGLAYTTTGSWQITARDFDAPTVLATADITVGNSGLASFTITKVAPASPPPAPYFAYAGQSFQVTVTARDTGGNPLTSYAGVVHLALDAGTGTIPADYTFKAGATGDNGQHTFTIAANLSNAQSPGVGTTRTITVNDTLTTSVTGTITADIAPSPATHLQMTTSVATSVKAGTSFTVTGRALDAYDNTDTYYRGTVGLTATSTGVGLVSATYSAGDAGVHTWSGVSLAKVGTQTITGTSSGAGPITGNVAVAVIHGDATKLVFESLPAGTPVANVAFTAKVTAYDANDNIATGYRGTVSFASTVSYTTAPYSETVPAATAFTAVDNGSHTFSFTLQKAGARTLIATDAASGLTQASASVTMTFGALAKFVWNPAPGATTAGVAFTPTLEARDTWDNVVTNYTGTVNITLDASAGTNNVNGNKWPTSGTFAAADNGKHLFTGSTNNFTLTKSGTRRITATQTGAGGQPTGYVDVTINPATTSHFSVTSPIAATAGTLFSATVTALDPYDNQVPSYAGSVSFSLTGAGSTVPGAYTFVPATDAGAHAFTSAFKVTIAPTQTLTVTAATTGYTGAATVNVTAAALSKFAWSGLPTPNVTAGVAFGNAVTLTAQDTYGNTVTTYSGSPSLAFDTPNPAPPQSETCPTTTTLVSGVKTFTSTTFKALAAGSRTVTATSGATTGVGNFTVVAGAAHHLLVAPASTGTAGQAFSAAVTAQDIYNNKATSYVGQISLTLDGTGSTVTGSPYKFVAADAGAHTFSNAFMATLAGTRTLNAVDTATASITGSGTISIGAATPTTIAWGTQPASTAQGSTLATVTVQLKDTHGNVCTNFSSATNAVSLKIRRNPSQGRFMSSSTTSAFPTAGVATFNNLKIDKAGTGYTIAASYSTFTAAVSSQFNITYAAPSFVGTPTLTWPSGTSKRGCPTITYTLKHPSSESAKVTGRWTTTSTKDATPLGTGLGSDGTFGVTTSANGLAHTYTWDSPADLGQTAYAGLKLRLEAKVGDAAAAATADFTFDLDNNWSGTWTPTAITTAIAPRLVAVGDLDRDGFGDVVVPGGGRVVIQFFDAAAQKLANEQSVTVTGATDLYAAAVGDIDSDGDLDIVVADRTSGVVTLKRVKTVSAHSLTFETDVAMTPCSFTASDTVPRVSDVAIGDFDRDGQNDFAIACTNKKIVEVHSYVTGTPGTTRQLSISPVSGMSSYKPVALAVAEIDGDGYPDLVVGHDLGVSYTYRGGAAAVVLTVKATHRDFTAVTDVAVGDLDYDGYVDVALANTKSTAGIYWGTAGAISGTSPTTRSVAISGTSYVVESVDIGDVDRDGREDLVLGSIATDNAFLMRSTSFRTSTNTTTDASQQLSRVATPSSGGSQQTTLGPARVVVADMNRDGQPDITLARGSATTQTAGVILSNWALAAGACTPTFDAPALASEQLTPIEGAIAVDLNGDAKPDLLDFSNSSTVGEGISISYGRGDGRFEALDYFLATESNGNTADDPAIVVTGDFDGDTDLDVATLLESAAGTDGRVLAFYQTDEYDFTAGAQVAGSATAQKALVAGDIDLDGDSDLAMLTLSASTWTIKAYAASAQSFALFASGTITLPAGSTAQHLDMADLNADGILDFVFKRSGTTSDLCTVISTSTTAPFWTTTIDTTAQCISSARSTFSFMKLADMTGDGKPEVVATAIDGQGVFHIDVFDFTSGDAGKLNALLDTSTICTGYSSLAGLELADLNQDGRLDAIARCGISLAAAVIYVPYIYPQQASGTRFLASTYSNFGDYASSTLSHTTPGRFGGPDRGLLYRGQTFHFDAGTTTSDDVAGVTANGTGADLVVAANIDGHAGLDLITAVRADDTWWDAKQGPNGWGVTSHSPGTGRQIDAIAVGDGNGDGLPDVLVSEQLNAKYNLHWYFNSAGSYSAESAASLTAAGAAIDVARIGLEDMSASPTVYRQDAFDDFVVGLSNPTSADGLTVFANLNGAGQPTQVTASAAMPDVIKHIDAGLLRAADKYRILAVAGDCGTTTIVPCVKLVGLRYLTSYSLQLSSSLDFSGLTATTLYAMAVGDLNRDGRDDVVTVIGTATKTQIVAFLQGASNAFTRILVAETAATFPDKLRLADVDRDGYLDLVLHDPSGATSCGAVEVLYQAPTTYTSNPPTTVTLQTGHALMASGHCVDDLDVGDIDRSGRIDVITLDAVNSVMRALLQK